MSATEDRPVSRPKIGFVGLGTMGGQMARRLVSSGYEVTGFDPSGDRAKQAAAAGVTLASSPAAAAKGADVVLSSLPDPAIVRRAYLGPDGVLSATRPGATLIDMSTIDPDTWREVATAARAAGVDALDAPVSGGAKPQAEPRLTPDGAREPARRSRRARRERPRRRGARARP